LLLKHLPESVTDKDDPTAHWRKPRAGWRGSIVHARDRISINKYGL